MNYILIKEIENFITDYYQNNLSDSITYHNLTHVKSVVKNIKLIAENLNIEDNDLEMLIIAGWFHDIGHSETWENHEKISAKFAEEYLQKKNYDLDKINKVKNCILATKVPHSPGNKLEEIICDADIVQIGTSDFCEESQKLKEEYEVRNNVTINKKEWIKRSIKFLEENSFHTDYAKAKYAAKKNENLTKLKNQLRDLS